MDLHNKTRTILIDFISGEGYEHLHRFQDEIISCLELCYPGFKANHPDQYTSSSDLAYSALYNSPGSVLLSAAEYFLSLHFYIDAEDCLSKDANKLKKVLEIDGFTIIKDQGSYKILPNEKEDINNTLIDLALDARQDHEEGNYSSFKEAYTHYANTYTSNGKSFTAEQLENAYQSAKSKGRI